MLAIDEADEEVDGAAKEELEAAEAVASELWLEVVAVELRLEVVAFEVSLELVALEAKLEPELRLELEDVAGTGASLSD